MSSASNIISINITFLSNVIKHGDSQSDWQTICWKKTNLFCLTINSANSSTSRPTLQKEISSGVNYLRDENEEVRDKDRQFRRWRKQFVEEVEAIKMRNMMIPPQLLSKLVATGVSINRSSDLLYPNKSSFHPCPNTNVLIFEKTFSYKDPFTCSMQD